MFMILVSIGLHYLYFPLIAGFLFAQELWWFLPLYLTWVAVWRTHLHGGWEKYNLVGWKEWDRLPHAMNARLIRETELDPERTYLFAIGPHAIVSLFRTMCLGSTFAQLFPGIKGRFAGATPMFWIPILRELALAAGAIDASKPSLQKALRGGESVFLIPGGTRELFEHDSGSEIRLVERTGFVRLAQEQGADLGHIVTMNSIQRFFKIIYCILKNDPVHSIGFPQN